MATTVAKRLLFKCTFTGKSCHPIFSIGVRLLSTDLHPTIDVKKLCSNCGPFPWKLYAAVCVVRLPIVDKGLADNMKLNYATMRSELENDVLCKWALEKQQQKQLLEGIKFGEKNLGSLPYTEVKQDVEDNYGTLFETFKESPIEVGFEAEFSNRDRRPQDSLILLTKQQLGNDMVWMLPKEEWRDGEDLKESATRALEKHCDSLVVDFVPNSPSGFYKHKFPRGARDDTRVGAKLFIHKAFVQGNAKQRRNPTIQKNTVPVLGHAWVAKDEMRKFMKPKYIAAIDNIVFQ